jgi:uncharacterized protein involved in exopolysaccharide biosynthesis
MNTVNSAAVAPEDAAKEDVGAIELLIAVARHKKQIMVFSAAVTVVAAAISFVLPDVYKANAKLLPPQQAQSSAAAMLSQLGGMAGMAAGMTGLKNPNDLYVGMLKSRTVADRLISQFDLKKNYDTDSLDKARKILDEKTTVTAGKDGLITIEVEDDSQKLVARLANGYVNEIMRLTRVLAVTEASQRRVFFEQQLEQSKNNLATAETALKRALDSRGVISVDAESRAVMETVARLKAQVSAKEIQLNAMSAFVTASHPDYKRTSEELSSLRGELSKLENGRPGAASTAIGSDGKGGFENIQLLRDVKYYQMLYELLAKQYEVARLDEAKEPSVIQVLDSAVEPERKFKPKRTIIVLVAAFLSLFLGAAAAIVSEAKRRALQQPEFSLHWNELRANLRIK